MLSETELTDNSEAKRLTLRRVRIEEAKSDIDCPSGIIVTD
jgi:hypothetical protein